MLDRIFQVMYHKSKFHYLVETTTMKESSCGVFETTVAVEAGINFSFYVIFLWRTKEL